MAVKLKVRAVSPDEKDHIDVPEERMDDLRSLWPAMGPTEESARKWGLVISAKGDDTEAAQPRNVPFSRPTMEALRDGLRFIVENACPIRGHPAA